MTKAEVGRTLGGYKVFKKFLGFVLGGVFTALLVGCASTVPMTSKILNTVGGEDNIENFQYYISKTITLRRVETASSNAVVSGQAKMSSTISRETITISSSTPGIVLKHNSYISATGRLCHQFYVAFENDDDALLRFVGLDDDDDEDKYTLQYDKYRNENMIINYGGTEYTLNYAGDERPYLLIKMTARQKEINRARTARGRTLPK